MLNSLLLLRHPSPVTGLETPRGPASGCSSPSGPQTLTGRTHGRSQCSLSECRILENYRLLNVFVSMGTDSSLLPLLRQKLFRVHC